MNFSLPLLTISTGRYPDRDMSMRYRWGSGVGHRYPRRPPVPEQTFPFQTDITHHSTSSTDAEIVLGTNEAPPLASPGPDQNLEQSPDLECDLTAAEDQLTEDHMVFTGGDESDADDDLGEDSESDEAGEE
jgi:hypothetical protein